ncbi:hypothetical protein Poly30_00440 [Planctomycetes bacterium Poly30]|uniref:Uncharacterized protein n=1 Tax=Saltatorellus ferox TaxID=2528018 RepID=A0A518EKE1_9BACT|nr:hypothetical protein Poly30_00440 [Planctomycetes bacterium Poly30]
MSNGGLDEDPAGDRSPFPITVIIEETERIVVTLLKLRRNDRLSVTLI